MALIELHDICKTYRMGAGNLIHALDHVSLQIHEGEFVAILGPSGSGKSTLMHLLGFLDKPTSGEMLFDGQKVSRISARRRAMIRAEKIGFVFQAFNLLPRLSVIRNTLLPLSYARHIERGARQRVWEVLEQVGMRDRARHRPNQLSGGQRQRVAIARALINRPRLILADEPTGNLDSNTALTIMQIFENLHAEGRTVIIVTHDLEVARWAKRQIRMRDGKVVEITMRDGPSPGEIPPPPVSLAANGHPLSAALATPEVRP